MNFKKLNIFRNWHFLRWIRLAATVFTGYEALALGNFWMGAMALIFLIQVIFDTGCCCSAYSCDTVSPRSQSDQQRKDKSSKNSYFRVKSK